MECRSGVGKGLESLDVVVVHVSCCAVELASSFHGFPVCPLTCVSWRSQNVEMVLYREMGMVGSEICVLDEKLFLVI